MVIVSLSPLCKTTPLLTHTPLASEIGDLVVYYGFICAFSICAFSNCAFSNSLRSWLARSIWDDERTEYFGRATYTGSTQCQ